MDGGSYLSLITHMSSYSNKLSDLLSIAKFCVV